ncbi:hypothetical protein LCGC14_2094790, partial [marine sediment metagenome]
MLTKFLCWLGLHAWMYAPLIHLQPQNETPRRC